MGAEKLVAPRAVIVLDVWKVQTSCGYGVPVMEEGGFVDRKTLGEWGRKTVEKGKMEAYRVQWNSRSLDGLLGLRTARREGREWWGVPEVGAFVKRVLGEREGLVVGVIVGVVASAVFRAVRN